MRLPGLQGLLWGRCWRPGHCCEPEEHLVGGTLLSTTPAFRVPAVLQATEDTYALLIQEAVPDRWCHRLCRWHWAPSFPRCSPSQSQALTTALCSRPFPRDVKGWRGAGCLVSLDQDKEVQNFQSYTLAHHRTTWL